MFIGAWYLLRRRERGKNPRNQHGLQTPYQDLVAELGLNPRYVIWYYQLNWLRKFATVEIKRFKADVSSVSPSSEKMDNEGLTLET